MPMNWASSGCFPSATAVASVSKEDYKRLYLCTTKDKAHNWRAGTHTEDDRMENMDQVLSMGAKNTKYMRYQVKRAPLVDRTALTSCRDFCPKPLGDNICNRELADTFRGPKLATSTPSVCKNESSYGATFTLSSRKQMRSAKSKSCAPDQLRTRTLGGTGDMMELKSNSHDHHGAPPRGMSLTGECIIPKPNLTLIAEPVGAATSQYNEDYIGPRKFKQRMLKCGSAPVIRPADILAGMNFHGEHEEMFGTRRACFLSPGQ